MKFLRFVPLNTCFVCAHQFLTTTDLCVTRILGNKGSWMCEGASGHMLGKQGLHCLPDSFPVSVRGRHKTA